MSVNFKRIRLIFAIFICALCLGIVFYSFDWTAISVEVKNISWPWLIIGSGLGYVTFLILRTARWLILIQGAGAAIKFSELYCPLSIFLSLSLITPAQVGEMLKVELLKRSNGISYSTGIKLFLWERVLDLAVVSIIAVGSIAILLEYSATNIITAVVFGGGLMFAMIVWANRLPRFSQFLKTQITQDGIGRSFLRVLVLTILTWLVVGICWVCAIRAMGSELGFLNVVSLMSVTTLSVIFSMIPTGLGVAEIVEAKILLEMGLSSSEAQGIAIVLRIASLWWLVIGLGHFVYSRLPIHFGERINLIKKFGQS